MKFYSRKRRPAAIHIVSLIDILAILLIFFIVTTTFKKQQPQLMINLPKSERAAEVAGESEPLLLGVKSREEIALDAEPVPLASLAAKLRDARERDASRPLALQIDEQVPFELVVAVLDALKEAGVENIPAFTRPTE